MQPLTQSVQTPAIAPGSDDHVHEQEDLQRRGRAPVRRFYRPSGRMSATELNVMRLDGVLQHVIADLYAPVTIASGARLRAQGVRQLLSPTLRRRGVVCGETAAWVYGGGAEPRRLHIITDGVFRRPTKSGMEWSIHQIPLADRHIQRIGGVPVTSAERTAADLLMGRGCEISRSALDVLEQQLYRAPESAERRDPIPPGLAPPSHSDLAAAVEHRQHVLSRMLAHHWISAESVIDTLTDPLFSAHPVDAERAARLAGLLPQDSSLRFPTVR